MKRLVLAAIIAACLLLVRLKADTDPGLTKLLAAEAARFPGKLTIYVKQLPTGQEASVAPDEPMNSMSVIKLGILAKAYQMAERGSLDLKQRLEITKVGLRGGSGILQFHAGLNADLSDLLWEMVITSDNTATDAMLARVGGVQELNRWFASAGFPSLKMNGTISAYFARVARLLVPAARDTSERELNMALIGERAGTLPASAKPIADALADPTTWLGTCERFQDSSNWLGSITARDVARLLEQMEVGTIASKKHSAEMMDMLKNQQMGARRIPLYLDTRYEIGHKTGDFPPCTANDVGAVYLKRGPCIMVFLSDQIRGNYGEAEIRIGEIARQVAEYFDGN